MKTTFLLGKIPVNKSFYWNVFLEETAYEDHFSSLSLAGFTVLWKMVMM